MKRRLLHSSLVVALFLAVGVQQATAQDYTYDDSLHYSLYREAYNNGDFASALPDLLWILEHSPAFPANNDRNFERAVEVYEHLAEAAPDAAARREHLGAALAIFDTAVSTLQDIGARVEPFEWVFMKGRFIQQHQEDLADLQPQVGELYREAYAMEPGRLAPYYIDYIIRDFVQRGDKAGAVAFMEDVEAHRAGEGELMEALTIWRDALFTDPAERAEFLEQQLAKNPDDAELRSDLFDLYLELGDRARALEQAEYMMAEAPTARLFRQVARMRLDDGEYEEAIRLYEQSLQMEGGQEAAREVFFNIGIAHGQQGRLANARTSYRRALEADPNFGQAYLAIGDLYVRTVAECGSMERKDKTVYWLATDYFERARSVDPSVAAAANQRIRNIKPVYPTPGDLHFANWTVGDRYMVDASTGSCYAWINEATTVRPGARQSED